MNFYQPKEIRLKEKFTLNWCNIDFKSHSLLCVTLYRISKKLTASFWNTDEGGLLLGAFTLSAVKCANLSSDLSTVSRSKSFFSDLCFILFSWFFSFNCSFNTSLVDSLESFKDPELPLCENEGGLGFGGGVDFPKECFLAVKILENILTFY